MYHLYFKRALDFIVSLVAIVILCPVYVIVAILVKVKLGSPVLFCQERPGLNEKIFKMYKFRTMRVQTEGEERKGWTVKDDPRVTRIGAIMRKTSLDELPQLWNIFVGDMSIVGPRPERPQFVEKFKEEILRLTEK